MHALSGKKQSPEHVAKRMAAMKKREVWPHGSPPKYSAESLWENVDRRGADDCWPWKGWSNAQGYGRVEIDGRSFYAHRVIYDLASPGVITREAPKDRSAHGFLRHSCDNPCCCNPKHLLPGTHADNMRDKVERGRQPSFLGTKGPRAKLTAEDVRFIRKNHTSGGGSLNKPQLAEEFGVSIPTIKSVLSGRHYSDVT